MEQILLAYCFFKETATAIIIHYRNTKVKVRSPDRDTDFFKIVARDLRGVTLALYLFINCVDYIRRTSTDLIKENGLTLKKSKMQKILCRNYNGCPLCRWRSSSCKYNCPSRNPTEIAWSKQQETLFYIWIQTKWSTCVLIEKASSPF